MRGLWPDPVTTLRDVHVNGAAFTTTSRPMRTAWRHR
jgi:hypothetical protein